MFANGECHLINFTIKILQYFEDNPNKQIVFDHYRSWSWSDLIKRADDYARLIRSRLEASNQQVIPILTDRSGETVAAIIGALQSGHAFAPINPNQPLSRINECLKLLNATFGVDASVEVTGTASRRSTFLKADLSIPSLMENQIASTWEDSAKNANPDSELYTLFTSGSTGKPKGVVATHKNIVNTMEWSLSQVDWLPTDVIGCCTEFSFDISMFDIFTVFYCNTPIAIFKDPKNVNLTIREIEKYGVSSIFGVPTFFSSLAEDHFLTDNSLKKLRRIMSGGDFFPPAHILKWFENRPDTKIYNVWGPTETSIVNTMHLISNSDLPSLRAGKSAAVGSQHERMPFCLLDENDAHISEPYVHGEICMLGDCVTKGYLGDPVGTKDSYTVQKGKRAFKTSDMGFLDQEGRLFIIGRIGTTVKISGFRIDLVEIEISATNIDGVRNSCAFVTSLSDPDIKILAIAVEPTDPDQPMDLYDFKKKMRVKLPTYMVPKKVIFLESLPKNINGKIDRKKVIELCSIS